MDEDRSRAERRALIAPLHIVLPLLRDLFARKTALHCLFSSFLLGILVLTSCYHVCIQY